MAYELYIGAHQSGEDNFRRIKHGRSAQVQWR